MSEFLFASDNISEGWGFNFKEILFKIPEKYKQDKKRKYYKSKASTFIFKKVKIQLYSEKNKEFVFQKYFNFLSKKDYDAIINLHTNSTKDAMLRRFKSCKDCRSQWEKFQSKIKYFEPIIVIKISD